MPPGIHRERRPTSVRKFPASSASGKSARPKDQDRDRATVSVSHPANGWPEKVLDSEQVSRSDLRSRQIPTANQPNASALADVLVHAALPVRDSNRATG